MNRLKDRIVLSLLRSAALQLTLILALSAALVLMLIFTGDGKGLQIGEILIKPIAKDSMALMIAIHSGLVVNYNSTLNQLKEYVQSNGNSEPLQESESRTIS